MIAILNFISNYINVIIGIMGLGILIIILINYGKLRSHRRTINDLLQGTMRESKIDARTGKMAVEEKKIEVSIEQIRAKEIEFQKDCSISNSLAQVIPVFPSLGILGTVSGLMLQVQAQDIQAMMDSLGVALSSTFWGLICTIILKIIMALCNSKCIYDTEMIYASHDKELSTDIGMKNVTSQE